MKKIEVFSCSEFSLLMIKELLPTELSTNPSYEPIKGYTLKNKVGEDKVELMYITKIYKQ